MAVCTDVEEVVPIQAVGPGIGGTTNCGGVNPRKSWQCQEGVP